MAVIIQQLPESRAAPSSFSSAFPQKVSMTTGGYFLLGQVPWAMLEVKSPNKKLVLGGGS